MITKKLSIILITILATLGSGVYLLFYPVRGAQKVVDDYLSIELQGGITSRDLTKRINSNPLNPKYIYVGNYGGLENEPDSFRVYYYLTLKRTGIFHWEIEQQKSRHGFSYLNIEDTVNLLEENNILNSNPEPEQISIFELNRIRQFPGETYHESYEDEYYDLKKISQKPRYIENFKNLKLNMSAEEIKAIVGNADISESNGEVTKKFEKRYKLDEKEINFIVLAFDADTVLDKNAKLVEAKIVYNDRKVEDLNLETK